MHTAVDLKVPYFGTPVVLIGSRTPDGTPDLAPMSSSRARTTSTRTGGSR